MLDWIFTIVPEIISYEYLLCISQVTNRLRVNTSHIHSSALKNLLEKVSEISSEIARTFDIVLDLQGAKLRIGKFINISEPKILNSKLYSKVLLISELESDDISKIPIPHKEFFEIVEAQDEVHINDGYIVLKVISKSSQCCCEAEIIKNDFIDSYKSISIPAKRNMIKLTNISQKDREIIGIAKKFNLKEFALSYITSKSEVEIYKNYLANDCKIIAKIERIAALESLDELSDSSDEVWLCRGDLGAELGFERIKELSTYQRYFESKFSYIKKPKFIAGEVLKSMVYQNFPTRTEIVHLCDIEAKGYNGVVLSDETAVGKRIFEIVDFINLFRNKV